MNLYRKLLERKDNPLRIGVIGAGKFGAMYIAQVPKTPGVHLVGIADLSPENARENLARVGWLPDSYSAKSLDKAARNRTTHVSDDWETLVAHPGIDIIIESTGNPPAAVEHALAAFRHGKHVVMVTVEADAFCGPVLAQKAKEAGVVYSLAYGDQPALICDLVDWARAAGFPVVAAGRGHKWQPHFAQSTPETVWGYYGLTPEQAKIGGLNPKMFNSFLDGSKPAIETTAVCNATGLTPAPEGLLYPAGSIDEIPALMRPRSEGGVLHHKGQVEVISSLTRDGTPIPYDIRFGVWVVFEAESDYIKRCFEEYGVKTDPSGRYACLYKRWHLIGLEVGISVASVGLRGEPTGCATGWRADAVAVAKKNLKQGEILDGEGGYTVVGRLMPAADSLDARLPAARPRARLEDAQAGRRRPAAQVERRRFRRELDRRAAAARDGVRSFSRRTTMGHETRSAIDRLNWLGIVLIALGVAAVLTPAVAGSAVVMVIGFILLVAGIVPVVRGLKAEAGMEKAMSLILGIIIALAGIAVIGHPLLGLAFLTLLLVAYFVAEGVWKIVVSFRYKPATGWKWLLASGVLSLLLGLLIWNQWPVSGMWAVGVLVGVNLFGTGLALVTLASTLNKSLDRGA